MSILLDEETPVLVHGLPDDAAMFYTNAMLDYGTDVVAGVCHQHAGTRVLGRPVFATVEEGVRETQATTAVIFRDSATVTDAILESADAGLQLIVAITLRGRVPVRDKLSVNRFLERWPPEHRPLLLGPDAAGIMSAGLATAGVVPPHIFIRGSVGIVTRAASLGYEATARLTALGIGQSTFVGLGADNVFGGSYVDMLTRFESDAETRVVLLIGDRGGPAEARAALIAAGMSKPVIAYLPAPPRPTGRAALAEHLIAAYGDQTQENEERIASSGMIIIDHLSQLGSVVGMALTKASGNMPQVGRL